MTPGTVWLHIGSPKTGTTSLQGFLNANATALAARGVNYVRAGRSNIAHNRLAMAARRGSAAAELAAIDAECHAAPEAEHILSSELLFNAHTARRITTAISAGQIPRCRIVCYLRRQDSYLAALYKQLLKNGRIPPDREAFLANAPRHARYLETLAIYADRFGAANLIVRPFARDRLAAGDIVVDFANLTGLDFATDMERNATFANKTFSVEMSELIARTGTDGAVNTRELIRELISLDLPGTIRAHDVFTLEQRRRLMAGFTAENAEIARRFLPADEVFFNTDDLYDGEVPDPVPDAEARQADRNTAREAIMTAIENLQARTGDDSATATPPQAAPEPGDFAASAPADQPPSWYREIYPAGPRNGFYHRTGPYSCSFVDRGPEQLVVTFDNLHNAGDPRLAREPWAQKFVADKGYSHLGVYAQAPTWFRDADFIAYLEQLRDQGFFARFRRVALTGTSMGGFAALAFASLAPCSTVIAYSPQTTLDTALVPWERRFAKGRAADWSLPFSDAATEATAAARLYVVYDPYLKADRRHVDRLEPHNLVRLKGFGLGHKSALTLNRMDRLKQVMDEAIKGTLNEARFYAMIRARKNVYIYRQAIEGYLVERGQTGRAEAFHAAFKRRRQRLRASAKARAAADQT